jgi:hypothetical protein
VIGIYVAGFGILSPNSDGGKWWIFGVCFVLVPVFIALSYLERERRSNTKLSSRSVSILLIFGLLAFVAWAAALPGTPFLTISPRATAIGGWSVIILAAVMYKVADLLGVVPKRR